MFDQVSKWWAVERLGDGEIIDVVGSLVLRLTYNTGTAFSLGSGRNLGPVVFLLALGLVAALIFSGSTSRRAGAVTVGLVAGGAVGNLIDRALRTSTGDGFLGGGVVDFVDLGWWPVFNVADASIVVGALSLVVVNVLGPDPG